jgi:hypothetical protein
MKAWDLLGGWLEHRRRWRIVWWMAMMNVAMGFPETRSSPAIRPRACRPAGKSIRGLTFPDVGNFRVWIDFSAGYEGRRK